MCGSRPVRLRVSMARGCENGWLMSSMGLVGAFSGFGRALGPENRVSSKGSPISRLLKCAVRKAQDSSGRDKDPPGNFRSSR